MLDEETKRKRKRDQVIGIQTTALSWSVEFASGGLVLLDVFFGLSGRDTWERTIIPAIDMLFCSIIIPCTYVVKSESIRDMLSDKGWSLSFRECLHLRTDTVNPQDNIQMNPLQNIPNRNPAVISVSTISNNIETCPQTL